MKLEDFLYDWLTNMLEFRPGEELREAIHNYVYKGTTDGPPPWTGTRPFREECDKAADFFIKFQTGLLNKL